MFSFSDDVMDKEEVHHFDEGSGWYDEYHYSDDSDDTDYGPEDEDQTEPPLYITEENDLYQNPPPPPRGNKDDFGFVEDNQLNQEISTFRNSHKNAKSSHHSKSATSQQQPVITSGASSKMTPTGSRNFFGAKFKLLFTWLLVFSYAAPFSI